MKHAGTTVLALLAVIALAAPVRTASLTVAAPDEAAAASSVRITATDLSAVPEIAAVAPEIHVQTQSLKPASIPVVTSTASTASKTSMASKTVASRPVVSVSASRTAYLKAMYVAVVPARQRALLAGRYVLGYALPGMACGTGCSGLFNGQARSSFSAAFFTQPIAYQRNILAHEAAHAYGFLFIANYATSSWAGATGWQAQFHRLDRSFAGTYDAEAWASCVAWKQSGFNNRVLQIARVCTPQAAALAMQHLG